MGNTFKLGNYVNGIFQDASNNIGIGGSPSGSYKLEVTGTAKVSSTLLVSGSVTSDDLILTAGTLFGAGNTGFSNRSSDTTLYLQMPATGFNITDNALNTRFILSSAGAATFYSSVTAAGEYVNTSGNASRIFFSGTATTGYQYVNIKNTSASLLYGIEGNTTGNLATGDIAYSSGIYTGTATALHFGSNQVVGMTISTSNNVLIGTTSIINTNTGILQVLGTTTGVSINAALPNSASGGVCLNTQSVTSASTGWYHIVCQSGNGSSINTNNLIIYGNGNVQNANNSYGGISDIKLKENIVDATAKLDKLMQVRIVNFNLKSDLGYETFKQIGVIAQELEQIFPSLVDKNKDFDAEGNDLGTTTKSVKMSVFVPILIKAMQEMNQQNQDLKSRLDKAGL